MLLAATASNFKLPKQLPRAENEAIQLFAIMAMDFPHAWFPSSARLAPQNRCLPVQAVVLQVVETDQIRVLAHQDVGRHVQVQKHDGGGRWNKKEVVGRAKSKLALAQRGMKGEGNKGLSVYCEKKKEPLFFSFAKEISSFVFAHISRFAFVLPKEGMTNVVVSSCTTQKVLSPL